MSVGFGTTHDSFKVTNIFLFPYYHCYPHTHHITYLCCKCQVWQALCLHMQRNSQHPQCPDIFSPHGSHHALVDNTVILCSTEMTTKYFYTALQTTSTLKNT